MKFSDLIQAVDVKNRGGKGDPEIGNLTYNSRSVTPGSLFIAIPGFTAHGDRFIADAISRGATAVVSEHEQVGSTVPWVQVADPRKTMATLAKRLWSVNCDAMIMVGITGTNGKTTTANFYHTIYRQKYGADASWMFGTIRYAIGDQDTDAAHTTPEVCDLMRYIGTAPKRPRALVMEVSSHALELHRVDGLTFDIAVWTNLTQDHLDFHKTMAAYYDAKKRLFTDHLKKDGIAVINCDDAWGKQLAGELAGIACVTYGKAAEARVRIVDSKTSWEGTEVTVRYEGREHPFHSPLTGAFNVYNMTAFIAGALAKGFTPEEIQACLNEVGTVTGRMEKVNIPAPFTVVVDYAHTPDALANVLATARKLTSGRLITVFGCGGDRDRGKRPLMAQAVARLSDEAIITDDNPRTEDPSRIIDETVAGIPLDFPHQVIRDRRQAILKAMQRARRNDCVVIAGKGHETYQEIQGVRHHFDDRETAEELFGEMDRKPE